jgi:DNA-directed RNA polymerase subunit RPC12/RpoP
MMVFLPGIIVFGLLFIFGVSNFYSEYACPNCGHRFSRTIRNTLCSEMATYLHPKANYLKCPKCKVRDECSSLEGR